MNRKKRLPLLSQWRNMSAFTGYRLSVVLLLGAFLMLPLPAPEKSQILSLAALQVIYGLLVVTALAMVPKQFAVATRAAIVSLLMVAFIVLAAITLNASEAALLLFIPVINAAFRLSGRGLLVVCGLSALAWIGIDTWSVGADLWDSPRVLAGLLPLALVACVVRALRDDSNIAYNRLTAMSQADELTGMLNMRSFLRLLMGQHSSTEFSKGTYALLMIDIENLRALNNKHGHEQGDQVLKAVAEAVNRSIRSNDMSARYGGDEFMVYLAGADKGIAQTVSNRISQNVYNISLSLNGAVHRVEVSVGTAIYPEHGRSLQDMLNAADSAMYKQKKFYRNSSQKNSSDAGRNQAGIDDIL